MRANRSGRPQQTSSHHAGSGAAARRGIPWLAATIFLLLLGFVLVVGTGTPASAQGTPPSAPPSASPSARPTAAATPSATPARMASPSPTPSPTASPTATPTASP